MTKEVKDLWIKVLVAIKRNEMLTTVSSATMTEIKKIAKEEKINTKWLVDNVVGKSQKQLSDELKNDLIKLTDLTFLIDWRNIISKDLKAINIWFLSSKFSTDDRNCLNPWAYLIGQHDGYYSENLFSDYSTLCEDVDFFIGCYGNLKYVTLSAVADLITQLEDEYHSCIKSQLKPNINLTDDDFKELRHIYTIVKMCRNDLNVKEVTKLIDKK